MAQFARPDSIISADLWTGAATAIDESVASDADFINSPNNPNNTVQIGLSDVTDPQSSTGHVLRVRLCRGDADGSTPDSGGTSTSYAISLMQGAAIIASIGPTAAPTAWTTITLNLSGTEADAITNYADLRVHVTASGGGGSGANRRDVAVSWVELEVPDPPASQQFQHSESGSISPAGSLARRTRRALTATLGPTGALARRVRRALAASIGPTGALARRTGRGHAADLTFATSFSASLEAAPTPALVAVLIRSI